MKPLDEAIYWVEYVIRHGGAEHLRVAALKLNWYQYMLLDVIGFVLLVVMSTVYILKILLGKLFCENSRKTKLKIN